MELFDYQVEFLASAIGIQHSAPHRESNPVHVLDLVKQLFGGSAQLEILSLLRPGPVEPAQKIVGCESLRQLDRFFDRPSGDPPVIRQGLVAHRRTAEPQAAYVLESVVGETDHDVAERSVSVDSGKMMLGAEISHSPGSCGVCRREERIDRFPELLGTLDIRNVATSIEQDKIGLQRASDIY